MAAAQEAGAWEERQDEGECAAPPPPPKPGDQQPSVTASCPLTRALNTGTVRERPTRHSRYRRAYHTIPYHTNPNPGGNSEPSGGQSGPTTRSQTQAQREQGAKREHEGGDDGNTKKGSRFMRMARRLRNKGLEVTCPAEF